MKTTSIIYIFLAVAIAIALGWFLFFQTTQSPTVTPNVPDVIPPAEENVEKITYINATADDMRVELPFPGAVTGKEFSVIGKARGTWFFEASFPVGVLSEGDVLLASGIAQAQGEWMTENFVPFRAEIKVPDTFIGPAKIILKKDNPSGLPEHDASISFPITIEY